MLIIFPLYSRFIYIAISIMTAAPNGLRYLRWGGDGEAVQPEK